MNYQYEKLPYQIRLSKWTTLSLYEKYINKELTTEKFKVKFCNYIDKTLFINSIMYGYLIDPIKLNTYTDGNNSPIKWVIIDGKERCKAIVEFINNKFPWRVGEDDIYYKDLNIKDKRYFDNYLIDIREFYDCDKETMEKQYIKCNNT